MQKVSIGFIGGGRITQIFLNALFGNKNFNAKIIVSDPDSSSIERIGKNFPGVEMTTQNCDAANQAIVFVALHPPEIPGALNEIKNEIKEETILICLAPKLKMQYLSESLNSHKNIVRSIPNSPSIIKEGYNPISFYEYFDNALKQKVFEIFKNFGTFFETEESKLESYAIITAMGPTYFQFQIKKLIELAEEFGLTKEESTLAVKNMLKGMNNLLFSSDLNYEQIMDLIPVRPIQKSEDTIIEIFNSKLIPLYEKLTS